MAIEATRPAATAASSVTSFGSSYSWCHRGCGRTGLLARCPTLLSASRRAVNRHDHVHDDHRGGRQILLLLMMANRESLAEFMSARMLGANQCHDRLRPAGR